MAIKYWMVVNKDGCYVRVVSGPVQLIYFGYENIDESLFNLIMSIGSSGTYYFK